MITRASVASVQVKPQFANYELSSATGFVAFGPNGPVLVTNWHVVTGRHIDTGRPLSDNAAVPDELAICHHWEPQLLSGTWKTEPLFGDDGEPLWLEHPHWRSFVDVVALPLTQLDEVRMITHDVARGPAGEQFGPGQPVDIIGFPFGNLVGSNAAVWIRGTVASDPALGLMAGQLPGFLVDSRTRPGQSGSPVIAVQPNSGVEIPATQRVVPPASTELFLGVYSGRVHEDSDLGKVWTAEATWQTIANGVPGSTRAAATPAPSP